jgi:peptidoglycan/LPS O-acetylase OafA/YrhL
LQIQEKDDARRVPLLFMQVADTQRKPPRIDIIDGLRGLAILGVIFHHVFTANFFPGIYGYWIYGLLLSPFTMLSNGFQGVTLFFILSGFVLTLPYALEIRTMNSWQDVIEFYKRRAKRLLPLFYIHVLVIATLLVPGHSPGGQAKLLLPIVTFIFPLFKETQMVEGLNIVLWSLGVEVWFCVLMPWLFFLLKKMRMETLVLISIIIALLTRSYFGILDAQDPDKWWIGYFGVDTFLSKQMDFVLGMGLAYSVVKKELTRIPTGSIGLFFLIIGFLGADCLWTRTISFTTVGIFTLFSAIGMTFIMHSLVTIKRSWTDIIIGNWPLRLLGMMCYSLYIWHRNPIEVLIPVASPERFARYIILIFSLSFLTYRYIEFGSVKDIRSLLPRWRPEQDDTSTHLLVVSR